MSALRNVARVSLLAMVIGFAPAASALSQASTATGDMLPEPSSTAVSRATMLAVREAASPSEIDGWVNEAIAAHESAEEDRRVARAIEAQAANLTPGRFIWRPERAQSGPMEMVVSIKAQRIYVFRDRKLIGVSTVSSGMRGHATPTGTFPILQKNRDHRSNIYNDAPMPNMQRLTWDGIALHAGAIPGHPASHGCVRLPMEFSRILFAATKMGEIVHVIADTPSSPMASLDQAIQIAEARGSSGQARAR